ncbi:hypothetical protein [Nitrospirillum pindoramense]|uniref:MotA/TolQ/ExbB proton channel family protein n=1 Tax=Nitrospirillum amazonense TaxID=28077 RepID=A0A560GQM0_9PROT|nr:hypothetical protein [Nitrospirillum amazonense]TWB35780.1 hypothetical protein FBZ90_11965 [Nitrospirillum amazonense]
MVRKYVWAGIAVTVALIGFKLAQGGDASSFFLTIRELAKPVAVVYLALFGQPEFALVLAAGMMVACFALLAGFWAGQVRRTLETLKSVTASAMLIMAEPNDRRSASMKRLMESSPLLMDEWRMFESTLLDAGHGPQRRAYSTIRPQEYFSMEAMESRGLDFRFYVALPNYFVGVGLMFTFLGLVAGLYFASKGLQMGDLAQARQALGQLLAASTMKFVSSVVGIGASLVTSVVVRHWQRKVQAALDDLCRAVELCFPLISAHRLLGNWAQDGSDASATAPQANPLPDTAAGQAS